MTKRRTPKSKFQIPKVTRMLGYDIDVVREPLEGAYGYWTFRDDRIVIGIDSRLSEHRARAVYLHELCHAVSDLCGLTLGYRQVRELGNALAEALNSGK